MFSADSRSFDFFKTQVNGSITEKEYDVHTDVGISSMQIGIPKEILKEIASTESGSFLSLLYSQNNTNNFGWVTKN